VEVPIAGLPWADDAKRVEEVLGGRPGVLRVRAHVDRGTAAVTYDQGQTTAVALWNWLVAGRASGAGDPDPSDPRDP
jgi:hypothetical protein